LSSTAIVFRKELREILRDRRTLIAIAMAALATPVVLFVIAQVSTRTASSSYTVGYSGQIPAGLDVLFNATGLNLVEVADPAGAAKHQVDLGVVFTDKGVDEYYDPSRQSAQLADVRFQTILSKYDAAKVAASLQQQGVDPSVLNPLPVSVHPLSSPSQAAAIPS
jgi:ABC-type Na+ efflux pump permease subunit